MDIAPHQLAVRFLRNNVLIETTKTTKGKVFRLLNISYFAVSQIDMCIEWAINLIEK